MRAIDDVGELNFSTVKIVDYTFYTNAYFLFIFIVLKFTIEYIYIY